MATESKTIRLDDDVYERLAAEKRDDESFSEAVERLLGGDSVLDLYGERGEQGTEDLREAIEEAETANRERVVELRERGDE
ncbi:antitoxin VapB family protein [Halobaculum sp. MBLA0147]|uniref:antitoxin VapB family protein n=1 Tax=Halobaculum sp. MBLA0147 TaxID=3079934 RepID=UPI003524B091